MKRRCIHCGKTFDDEKTPLCPYCLGDNDPKHLDVDEVHHLHQEAHNHITAENDRFNAGMVNLIIGAILLLLGAAFLFLSFKYNVKKVRVFRPESVEFIMSVICLSVSLLLLSTGTVKVIRGVTTKKFFNKVIEETEIKKEPQKISYAENTNSRKQE
jgi:hypothetical protein